MLQILEILFKTKYPTVWIADFTDLRIPMIFDAEGDAEAGRVSVVGGFIRLEKLETRAKLL